MRTALADCSWSQVKRLIAQRHVQIQGNVCLDGQRVLQVGDVVKVSERPLVPPVNANDIALVHFDEQVVVVDKPPGVTTLRHPEEKGWSAQRKNREPTLEEWVAKRLAPPETKSASSRTRRTAHTPVVRAVHRLDRDTSGLMVFARTPTAETHLIRQFKKHSVERAYIAIAVGRVSAGTMESYLVRNRGDGLRGSVPEPYPSVAERAVTHITPLETLRDYTVLQCRLETGRTHQIRIHLSEAGHPLCGEKVYTHKLAGEPFTDSSAAPRQMLHAAVLGFIHPTTQQPLQFLSPLPPDMQRVLERLRRGK
jgi:23S rRNA pseudouridine1911/1915/1917 synthase